MQRGGLPAALVIAACALAAACGRVPATAAGPTAVTVRVGGHTHRTRGLRRGGVLFVPGATIYGHLPHAAVHRFPAVGGGPHPEVLVAADNGVWRTAVPVLACTAGGDCLKRGDGRVVAFGPHPVLVGGRVLVPVVAALPDIRVRVRGGAVTVTPEGWPGTQLPATAGGAALGLWGPGTPCLPPDQAQPAALPPGAVADLGVCFRNAHGLQLSADRRPAVAFRVPPASPLRLAAPTAAGAPPLAGGGAAAVAVPPTVPLATPYVAVRASAARDVAQGRWALTIRVPGHPPVRWRIRLADHRPYRLQVALAAPPVAGRAGTLLVTLRQRDGSLYRPGPGTAGRVCDLSSAAPVSGGPVVEVTGPGGTRTAAPVPAVCSSLPEGATAIGPVLFFQGAAHERFVPPRPGSYRATVTWPGFTLDGAPWSLRPATLDLSAAP